jgi:hypothetical protein
MSSQRLIHDCSWACAVSIVECNENCLRPEERTDALHDWRCNMDTGSWIILALILSPIVILPCIRALRSRASPHEAQIQRLVAASQRGTEAALRKVAVMNPDSLYKNNTVQVRFLPAEDDDE